MSEDKELEERLAAIGAANAEAGEGEKKRPSAKVAAAGVAAILGVGLIAYLALPDEQVETALQTAEPAEFQSEGEGFGGIEPIAPAPPPPAEVVEVETEENAALREQLEAMRSELEELRNAPAGEGEAAAAMAALTEQVAALQAASEADRQQYEEDREARRREIERLRSELEIARLDAENPMGPSFSDDPRVADLERRRAEAAAFEEARIQSDIVAFGGSGGGGNESELAERTIDAATDFVFNGAMPSQVTQAQIIANPANTVVQGTMIQAVTETALDSSLPGAMRAIVSEDVHSFDGSRVLIPRGSRLIGRYRSGVSVGQKRVTVAWDRIILPTNQTVTISSYGGDELGRSGVTGHVDTRFGARFGSAALISIIGAVPDIAAAEAESETAADVAEDVGDDLTSSTASVVDDYLSLGPVIYVDQGERITVMVDRDLEIF